MSEKKHIENQKEQTGLFRKHQRNLIKSIFTRHKRWKTSWYSIVEGQQPFLLFLRKNRKMEIREGMTKGRWYYKHSDGTERYLTLDGNPFIFKYAPEEKALLYIASEDFWMNLQLDPVIQGEMMLIHETKVINDQNKLKQRKKNEWAKFLLYAGLVIGGLIIVMSLFGEDLIGLWDKGPNTIQTIQTGCSIPIIGLLRKWGVIKV